MSAAVKVLCLGGWLPEGSPDFLEEREEEPAQLLSVYWGLLSTHTQSYTSQVTQLKLWFLFPRGASEYCNTVTNGSSQVTGMNSNQNLAAPASYPLPLLGCR